MIINKESGDPANHWKSLQRWMVGEHCIQTVWYRISRRKYEKSIEDGKKPKEYFDLEFYQNQLEDRTKYIERSKVTKELKVEVER